MRIFRFNGWMRFKTLELPFGANSLIWNSMMSWAGGWFFLMAAEIFTVGQRDFRLPGLGSYLSEAAAQGDMQAIAWGIATLVIVIVALDQLVWRPLLAWADRFKLEMVESETPPTSWFYDLLRSSRAGSGAGRAAVAPGYRALRHLDVCAAFPRQVAQGAVEAETPGHGCATILVALLAGCCWLSGPCTPAQMLLDARPG